MNDVVANAKMALYSSPTGSPRRAKIEVRYLKWWTDVLKMFHRFRLVELKLEKQCRKIRKAIKVIPFAYR